MSSDERVTRLSQRWRRLQDLVRAVRLRRRAFDPLLRCTPAQLAAYQDACWRGVARLAAARCRARR